MTSSSDVAAVAPNHRSDLVSLFLAAQMHTLPNPSMLVEQKEEEEERLLLGGSKTKKKQSTKKRYGYFNWQKL
uniref:Uncharacterized protein n=1 Tax=Caenorhabditis tropicalis TaxID=1561998 RepID=A0A1I7T5V0_9PELO